MDDYLINQEFYCYCKVSTGNGSFCTRCGGEIKQNSMRIKRNTLKKANSFISPKGWYQLPPNAIRQEGDKFGWDTQWINVVVYLGKPVGKAPIIRLISKGKSKRVSKPQNIQIIAQDGL